MSAAAAIEPLGTLWINAIRMTVIPLVVSSLIVGVTSAPDMRTIGRIGGRALVLFLLVLFAAGALRRAHRARALRAHAGRRRRRRRAPGQHAAARARWSPRG